MADLYVPLAQRQNQARIRAGETVLIALIYIGCGLTLTLAPDWQWIAILAAAVVPPAIEYFQPKIWHAEADSVRYDWFAGYGAMSVVGVLLAGIFLAPESIADPLLATVAGFLVICVVSAIAGWVVADPFDRNRRVAILLICATIGALSAAMLFGSPVLRWLAIGTFAALVVALFNRGSPGERRHEVDGFGFAIHQLDSALFALRDIQSADPHDGEGSVFCMVSEVLNGIAVMHNLHFVTDTRAYEFRKDIAAKVRRPWRGPDLDLEGALDDLTYDLRYARVRLEAHMRGISDPDIIAWEHAGRSTLAKGHS